MNNGTKTIYAVTRTHNGRDTLYVGDLQYLLNRVFGYTVECNGKYKEDIKSIRGLVNCLNSGTSYWSMTNSYSYRYATPEEIQEFKEEQGIA